MKEDDMEDNLENKLKDIIETIESREIEIRITIRARESGDRKMLVAARQMSRPSKAFSYWRVFSKKSNPMFLAEELLMQLSAITEACKSGKVDL